MIGANTTATLLSSAAADQTIDAEQWRDPTNYASVATGLPVRLSGPVGSSVAAPDGTTTVYNWHLTAPLCDLTSDMRVRDESTGQVYDVLWVKHFREVSPRTIAELVYASTGL